MNARSIHRLADVGLFRPCPSRALSFGPYGASGARAISLVLALALVLAGARRASAQTAPSEPERFDFEAALAEGARPLTVDDAVRLALDHSPRIDATLFGVTAAQASLSAARVALAPRLDGTARYAHIDGFPDAAIQTPIGAITIHIPRDQFALGARLTIPLSDIIFAAVPAMEAAGDRVEAEERRVDAARADVALQAIEAYFRYVEARGVVAVATRAREQAISARDRIVRYAEAGILDPADRAAAEARVAQAEEGIARGEAAVGVTAASLSILMGTPAGERYQVASAIAWEGPATPGTIESLETAALDQRPEILALRELISAQTHLRDATIAGAYPHLGLYGYAETSNPNPRVFPPREEFLPLWELGASVTWSPNDLATAIYRQDEISAQIERATAELQLAEDGVRLEVRQAYEELQASYRSIEAARASLDAAEVAYRLRVAQLAAGEAIVTDLLAADARVTDARLALLRVRTGANLSSSRLRRAVGATE